MTTIETTKSFDAVNSSEFVDASKDKKFGKETKEKLEKEDVKKLMKALKSVGEKQPKDGSVKMLKSILGVTDKDPTDQAVETARETIKKANMTVEEVKKKVADKMDVQGKLEGVKNVLAEYIGNTSKELGTLWTNKELRDKLLNTFRGALKGVSDFWKEQFFFFLQWSRKIASPKKVVESTAHIIEKWALAPMDMTKQMIGTTFGVVAWYPMIEAMKKANVVPNEKEVRYGLMNPFEFLQKIYKKSLEVIKNGISFIDPRRYGYLHNYFPAPVESLIPSLPHWEKEKEIREWFETAAKKAMDWMSEEWEKIKRYSLK